jgi:hypothetical protein
VEVVSVGTSSDMSTYQVNLGVVVTGIGCCQLVVVPVDVGNSRFNQTFISKKNNKNVPRARDASVSRATHSSKSFICHPSSVVGEWVLTCCYHDGGAGCRRQEKNITRDSRHRRVSSLFHHRGCHWVVAVVVVVALCSGNVLPMLPSRHRH